ncbi:hypothetical protein HG15A2_36250 [Adhaeretor mobilis]|uniref:Uncharacterized protein n=1 Tax=Adhaeretor mobilis TaxID=1930276 RepID=A0A517MZH6_9BACT|nr:hypothetical protein HG15A2_36250 [Adhaeretor mobilis]
MPVYQSPYSAAALEREDSCVELREIFANLREASWVALAVSTGRS